MPPFNRARQLIRYAHRAARRHWKKGASAFFAASFIALAGTLLLPRHYCSEAKLFVRFGRENQVDPSGGQTVSLYDSRESEINSLIEIFRSRAILDRVVKELGPEYVLAGRGTPHAPSDTDGLPSEATPPSRSHQQAVRELEKSVAISAPRTSNIITVAAKARTPQAAQAIVARLTAVCLDEHVRVHSTPGSYQFFAEQTRVSKVAWQAAAERLRDAKNRLGIVASDGKRRELEMQLGDTAAKLLANQSELNTSEGKIAGLKELIARLPEKHVVQGIESASASFDGMRQSLHLLESHEQELAAKMNDEHPKLAAVRQQVVDLRAILDAQPADRKAETEAINPARQSLELSLRSEQSQADAFRAREKSLVKQQQDLVASLTALNAKAGEIEQLEQQVALAEQNHRDDVLRLEQARINRSLDEGRFTSLSLVQPASIAAQASGPRRMLVLALGMLLAGGSAIGAIALAAWLNPLITTAEQLARLLDLPLAGSVS